MSFSPPAGTQFNIYQYESVDISASYLGSRTYTYTTTGSTTAMSSLVTNLTNYVQLSRASYAGQAPASESLVVNAIDPDSNVVSNRYPVTVGAGRFLPFSYNANISNGSNIVLYVNEAFTPIRFQTQKLAINAPNVDVNFVPTSLPVGLSLVKVGSNAYDLSGTPVAQAVTRNYRFFSTGASNSSQVVSNFASILVNPERVVLSPPGPTLSFSGLGVGSNLGSTPITATYPSNAIGNLLYTWTTLPPGFNFVDPLGAVITGNRMYSRDAASTITLTGTATIDTLNFLVANGNPYTTTLKATRQTQPLISNALGFRFSFQPSVILTSPVVNTQYVSVPFIPSGQPFFNAYSAFGSSSPITKIFSTNLVSDLSVIFHPATGGSNATADLSGTPLLVDVPGGVYTFRAINSTGLSTDISVNVPIALDSISMSSTMDVCSTLVLSRAMSNALTGYYKSPLQFTAYAGSGNSITFSAPALSGTGLSLSNVTPNTVQIVGTPTRLVTPQSLVVTAVAANTNATSSLSRQFSVANDVITISNLTVNAIQNINLTGYQLTASSLSGRAVISYTGTNLPSGLSITATGLITGSIRTPNSGTMTVNGSTGYASGTRDVSYLVTPDNILMFSELPSYTIVPGTTVSANIIAVSYSGGTVSNYRFSNLPNTFGMTINNTTGHIGGTLITGIPPNLLPSSCNFFVKSSAGALNTSLVGNLSTTNPYLCNQYLLQMDISGGPWAATNTNNGLFVSSVFSSGGSTPYAPAFANQNHGNDYGHDGPLYPTDLRIRPSGTGIGGRFLAAYNNVFQNADNGETRSTPYVAYSDNGRDFSMTVASNFLPYGLTFTYYSGGTYTSAPTFGAISTLAGTSLSNWSTAGYVGSGSPASASFHSAPFVWRSSTDGATWTATQIATTDVPSTPSIFSRCANGSNLTIVPYPTLCNSYTVGGFAVAYDAYNNRLLLGGAIPLTVTDDNYGHYTFTTRTGAANYAGYSSYLDTENLSSPFQAEIAYINTDVPGMYIASGTSAYNNVTIPGSPDSVVSASTYEAMVVRTANTMAYSTDHGNSWTPASWNSTDTSFNVIGAEIASDGVGKWLATGVYGAQGPNSGDGIQYSARIAYSVNGSNWTTFTLPNNPLQPSEKRLFPHLPLGPLYYDSVSQTWHVFVINQSDKSIYEYTHDNSTSLSSGWSSNINYFDDATLALGYINSNTRLMAARPTLYVKSPGDILSSLSFSSFSGTGPALVNPSFNNLGLVQYVPIDPIVFSGTGTGGTIYYYVATSDLPLGLSFNTQTATLSGTPAHTGSSIVRVFLKDGKGTSQYNFRITVNCPTVTARPLSNAGAYTSYIRQYTLADAAQNSRNNKVLTESSTLGEFMAPYGGDNISAVIDPKCKNPSC
jgi:hypothetical protein